MREDDEALVATVTYFRALRREWAARTGKPHDECPIPDWKDIRPLDQQSFLRCMKGALASAKGDNVARVVGALRL